MVIASVNKRVFTATPFYRAVLSVLRLYLCSRRKENLNIRSKLDGINLFTTFV